MQINHFFKIYCLGKVKQFYGVQAASHIPATVYTYLTCPPPPPFLVLSLVYLADGSRNPDFFGFGYIGISFRHLGKYDTHTVHSLLE